jgi:hypothetical protein
VPLPVVAGALLQSLLATSAVRQPLRDSIIKPYLAGPPRESDRYVLPVIKAYLDADRFMMAPVDKVRSKVDPIMEMVRARRASSGG